jgi:hypothetical protein
MSNKINEKSKVEIERELQEGIEKFLKNGGEIDYVKNSKSQQVRAKRIKVVEEKKAATKTAKDILEQIMNDKTL